MPYSVLAIITARAGSKRLPGKNKRVFAGKPLFQWAVEQAKASRLITTTAVSSDDEDILRLCDDLWCLKITRPPHLATDDATSIDVVLHAASGQHWDYVVLLQPTSPLRYPRDIDACIEKAIEHGSCISVYKGKPNGAVYAARADWLRAGRQFADESTYRYEMPGDRSIDIDTETDWRAAEYAMLQDMWAVA